MLNPVVEILRNILNKSALDINILMNSKLCILRMLKVISYNIHRLKCLLGILLSLERINLHILESTF